MRQISKILYFIVIMVFMVPVANVEANEKDALQEKFSAWREELTQWRQNRLEEGGTNELTFDDIMPAPDDPDLWPLWRDWLKQWRKDKRKELNYDDKYYRDEAYAWVPSSLVSTKIMSWETLFIDPETYEYTVDKFLDYGEAEYGGFDSVLLWQAYPRIGFDERNQFDYYRDLPGGLEGLREVVRLCHKRGVDVFINYNPWDRGTRREVGFENDDYDVAHEVLLDMDKKLLIDTLKAVDADGIYLDTWFGAPQELRDAMDEVRPGLGLETELALKLKDVATHHMTWGQNKPWKTFLFNDSDVPGVIRNKWFERRHMVHPTNRWMADRTVNLQTSWMNGTGTLVWENRFGSWDGWSPRDRSILRSMIPIQRRYVKLFSGEGWTPLVAHQGDDVFASLWEGDGLKLWTLVNRANETYEGELITVEHTMGTRYFDLIKGREIQTEINNGMARLDGSIDARWVGGLIAIPEKAITKDFERFLRRQVEIFGRRDDDTRYPEGSGYIAPTQRTLRYNTDTMPESMAAIDGGRVNIEFDLSGGGRPAKFHWKTPRAQTLDLSSYAIDLTPVTNKQYEKFLKDSGYKPRHDENFLKHWENGKIPAGKEDHPVVYVDLNDARAYAKWAGKRLPTQEEWQHAAQGPKRLKYPWGNEEWSERDEEKNNLCNGGQTGGTTSVYAFPEGRSPFGCYDMCGNTWEWTESERSNEGRSRFCYVRGGSFFRTEGSGWYVLDGPQRCSSAAKFLLIWPGLDRCSTIGFRCVVDLN
ncbi:MAG: formylglycine-generating enzyme family protein [Planctomycetota bacterium]|jgi:formylglycine-generating enzyme required for sulfatase activity